MENSSKLMFTVAMVMAYMAMGTDVQTLNSTVASVLSGNLSTLNCTSSKLCGFQAGSCTPGSPSCFFFSARQSMDTPLSFTFELAGQSSGYIALGLFKTAGGNGTLYACANNNTNNANNANNNSSNVLLFNLFNQQGSFSPNTGTINGSASVTGQIIQCNFSVVIPNAITFREASTMFSANLSTGTFNGGTLGTPNAVISTQTLDLSKPPTVVMNLLNNMNSTISPNVTAAPTTKTTNHAFGFQATSQGLLILLGVLGFMTL